MTDTAITRQAAFHHVPCAGPPATGTAPADPPTADPVEAEAPAVVPPGAAQVPCPPKSRWTAARREVFLQHLGETGNVTEAARLAGISRAEVYRRAASDQSFYRQWDDALWTARDGLLYEMRRRALDGVERPIVVRGEAARDPQGNPLTVRRHSETLLIRLIDIFDLENGKPLRR